MLEVGSAVLILIDVQGKLAQLMSQREQLYENLKRIVRGAQILGIPIIWNEQNPAGLGATIPELAELLTDRKPLAKYSFSCCGNQEFMQELKKVGRKQVLLAGIETHVCVYQTAIDLLQKGYEVHVIADAVSSRTEENKRIGLERMKEWGAAVTSTEMALFELLREATAPHFKEISKLLK